MIAGRFSASICLAVSRRYQAVCVVMGIIFHSFYMHSSPYLCVCGDDRMIYYPGADVLTGVMGF